MTQGGHENVLDLDDDAPIALSPKPVRIFGREWTIRREWTAAEVVRYWILADSRKEVEAAALLVGGEDAEEFARIISALPQELMLGKLRKLLRIAGLLTRDATTEEAEGKSSGSSTVSEDPGATPAPQTSDASTASR